MRRTVVLAALLLPLGCGGNQRPDIATLASNSDQLIWEEGQKAYDRKLWENARQHFKRIIDGFPQSEYGPAARLALGDSYYSEGGTASYILAVSAYRDFLTLYPSHARADYAQFQVAESFYRQKNPPDRDQTATREALDEYQRLLQFYPQSEHVAAARERIAACRQGLARAEFQVGYFYQRTRSACVSAIRRYQAVLDDYPDYEYTDEVLFRLGECLGQTGRAAEARPHLARLLQDYPQSSFAEPARTLMTSFDQQTPAGPPPAAPTPAPEASPTPPTAPGASSSET